MVAFGVIAVVALAVAAVALFDGDQQTAAQTAATATAATAASPSATPAMNAKAVMQALAAAGLPLASIAEQDENTDPNGRLGRPGSYISRASADVPGGDKNGDRYSIERGMVVEVFATAADADARSTAIQETLKAAQILGTEYHYRPADRRILVRLTGTVKPSQANRYEAAVVALAN